MAKAWTISEEKLATKAYLSGGVNVAAEVIGRSKSSIKKKMSKLGIKNNSMGAVIKTRSNYENGFKSRANGNPISSCPFDNTNLEIKHWWLAGWHDKDMELQ